MNNKKAVPTQGKNVKKSSVDSEDIKWYVLAGIFLVLAFIPGLMRTFSSSYQEGYDPYAKAKPKEISYKELICFRNVEDADYAYNKEIRAYFADGKIQKNIIKYEINLGENSKETGESIDIPEFTSLSKISSPGLKPSLENNVRTIYIDYTKDSNLGTNELLLDDYGDLVVLKVKYEEKAYSCTLNSIEKGKIPNEN